MKLSLMPCVFRLITPHFGTLACPIISLSRVAVRCIREYHKINPVGKLRCVFIAIVDFSHRRCTQAATIYKI